MTLLISAADHSWTITSTAASGVVAKSTGTWAVADTANAYHLISGNIVIFNALVSGSNLTLAPTALGPEQVMGFSK
jgi:hypothetical protein